MKMILITGVPGTGKTTTGDYLKNNHNFLHLDRERPESWDPELWEISRQSIKEFVTRLKDLKKDVVISWGFLPVEQGPEIKKLQKNGFLMYWFDGNRKASRKAFLQRGDVSEKALNNQIERINNVNIDDFSPIPINPFDNKSDFKPEKEISIILLNAYNKNTK